MDKTYGGNMKKIQPKARNLEIYENVKHYEGPKEKSVWVCPYQQHSIPDGLHRYSSAEHEESDHKTSKSLA